jgi:hypothetical protein
MNFFINDLLNCRNDRLFVKGSLIIYVIISNYPNLPVKK